MKVSLPAGTLTVPLHTVVQLTTVGAPALPPLGVTVTAADCVEAADVLASTVSALAVLAAGTVRLECDAHALRLLLRLRLRESARPRARRPHRRIR